MNALARGAEELAAVGPDLKTAEPLAAAIESAAPSIPAVEPTVEAASAAGKLVAEQGIVAQTPSAVGEFVSLSETATTVQTTNARMHSLLQVAESGQVRWLAGEETLYRAYQAAQAAGQSTATGREGFNLLRARLATRLTLTGPVHHWRFPITQFPNEAGSAQNLYATVGSAHLDVHRAIGISGAPFSSMAWGCRPKSSRSSISGCTGARSRPAPSRRPDRGGLWVLV